MSTKGVARVLSRPQYIAVAPILAFLFAVLIYGMINGGFYGPLLMSRLPIIDKIGVIGDLIVQLTKDSVTTGMGILLVVVSLLQGIAFAVMIYTVRRNKRMDVATVGGGTVAVIAAALGLGCVPCGTSLLLPILTLLFSSSAYAAANTASMIVLVLAFGLSLYSIYRLGYIAYTHSEIEKYNDGETSNDE